MPSEVHASTSDRRRSIARRESQAESVLLRFNPLMDKNMVVCYVVCYRNEAGFSRSSRVKHAADVILYSMEASYEYQRKFSINC